MAKKATKKSTKPASPAQLAQRAKFAAESKARAAAKKAGKPAKKAKKAAKKAVKKATVKRAHAKAAPRKRVAVSSKKIHSQVSKVEAENKDLRREVEKLEKMVTASVAKPKKPKAAKKPKTVKKPKKTTRKQTSKKTTRRAAPKTAKKSSSRATVKHSTRAVVVHRPAAKKAVQTVTADEILGGVVATAKAPSKTARRSGRKPAKIWVCGGPIRTGCGGGKKGGHVMGHLK
jgi:hypothetical protein